uniref:Uncharacterized protein n=1 Tax=Strongyloides stercoralis TaxID=6248 RepID=A0A0K0EJR4_STRER
MKILFLDIFYVLLFVVLIFSNIIEGCGARPNYNPRSNGVKIKKISIDSSKEVGKVSNEKTEEEDDYGSLENDENNKISNDNIIKNNYVTKNKDIVVEDKAMSYGENDVNVNEFDSNSLTQKNESDTFTNYEKTELNYSQFLNGTNNKYNLLKSNKTLSNLSIVSNRKSSILNNDYVNTSRYDISVEANDIKFTSNNSSENRYDLHEEIYNDNERMNDSYNLTSRYDNSNENNTNQEDIYLSTSYPNENYDSNFEDDSYSNTNYNNKTLNVKIDSEVEFLNKNNTNYDNIEMDEKE